MRAPDILQTGFLRLRTGLPGTHDNERGGSKEQSGCGESIDELLGHGRLPVFAIQRPSDCDLRAGAGALL